jgi:hypothetical protein
MSSFLIVDLLDGPWAIREDGLAELALQVGDIMATQPGEAWCRFYSSGLYAQTTAEATPQLLDAFEYVLTDETCTAVLGLDQSLERPRTTRMTAPH